MNFDLASFVLGVFAAYLIGWLGFQIIRVVVARLTEEEQWKIVQSQSSPSETYRGSLKVTPSAPETYDGEGSVTIRPASPRLETP